MTIDELLTLHADVWDKLTDKQLEDYARQYFPATRRALSDKTVKQAEKLLERRQKDELEEAMRQFKELQANGPGK